MPTAALSLMLVVMLQEGPAVSYREGLFEEVDQGNLDKAMQHYAKVLKGDADAALKAKALFRTGFCLEKLGRAKEAEQTYRDVIDRFAAHEETTKLARGRLAAMDGRGGAPGLSLEAEVQQRILDLGSNDDKVRTGAIRRLTLLGGIAVPELKRATAHKDAALSVGAASVLVELEQFDGLYEVFLRGLPRFGRWQEYSAFSRLLKTRPEYWERLAKDAAGMENWQLRDLVDQVGVPAKAGELQALVEQRIADEKPTWEVTRAWARRADEKQLANLVQLLTASGKAQYAKLYVVLRQRYEPASGQFDRAAVSAALRKGLEGPQVVQNVAAQEAPGSLDYVSNDPERPLGEQDSALHRRILCWLPHFMTPQDLLQGVFASWLKCNDSGLREGVLRTGSGRFLPRGGRVRSESVPGSVEFMFELVDSDDYAQDIRNLGLGVVHDEEMSAERRQKLARYYLGYLKKPVTKDTDPNIVSQAAHFLAKQLPPDSKDLDRSFDAAFSIPASFSDRRFSLSGDWPAATWKRYFEAALRAVRHQDANVQEGALKVLSGAAAADRLRLSGALGGVTEGNVTPAVTMFAEAALSVAAEARAAAMNEVKPLFKSGSAELRLGLFERFCGTKDPVVREVMKEALGDARAEIRKCAIIHWGELKEAEGSALLLQALKDPDDQNRVQAIGALASSPTLEAVPALIELLHSPSDDIRAAARSALKAIREHYEEQEEWMKWYREMKKSQPKDK